MQSTQNAIKAVIWAADAPAITERLSNHGNPAVRKAAEHIGRISSDHARNDYNHASAFQAANDALYYLPMPEIERLCAAYEAEFPHRAVTA
jgi:hypothetical protein